MDRGIKRACSVALLVVGVALAGCAGNQFAGCSGGYPDGGGISNMSPYSPNANPYQPDCEGRG
jgi:hypothetical protein